jgi:hypothetical protein
VARFARHSDASTELYGLNRAGSENSPFLATRVSQLLLIRVSLDTQPYCADHLDAGRIARMGRPTL